MGNTITVVKEKDPRCTHWNIATESQREVLLTKLRKVVREKPLNSDGTLDVFWMDFGDKGPRINYDPTDAMFRKFRKIIQEELVKRLEYPFVLIDTSRGIAWWTMYPVIQSTTESHT